MPRVYFVKKAQKDNPAVKKGESYYYWTFRYGGKRYSATPPKRSQLTQSPFLQQLYDLQDDVSTPSDIDDLEAWAESACDTLQDMRDECEERLDDMPEQLRDTSTSGELLQERIDQCDGAIGELQAISFEFDEEEGMDEDEWLEAKREEVETAIG